MKQTVTSTTAGSVGVMRVFTQTRPPQRDRGDGLQTEKPPRYLPSGFETPEKAGKESKVRQKGLAASHRKQSRALGQRLAKCSDDNPCQSAACPVCYRNYRITTISEVRRIYKQGKQQGDDWLILTLIFYGWVVTDKELFRLEPNNLKSRLYKLLKRAGIVGPVIGGLEVDFHTDIELWLPHFHLLIPQQDQAALKLLKTSMKKHGERDKRKHIISRPMHIIKVKHPREQISYLFKSYWSEVNSYLYDGKRRTRKIRLNKSQHELSLRVLDRWGFTNLKFQYEVRNSSIAK